MKALPKRSFVLTEPLFLGMGASKVLPIVAIVMIVTIVVLVITHVRGNHLSNATCLTRAFFKRGE